MHHFHGLIACHNSGHGEGMIEISKIDKVTQGVTGEPY